MPIFINSAAVKELTNSAYASTGKGFACKTSEDMIDIFLSVGSGDVVISGRLTPSTRNFTYDSYATKSELGKLGTFKIIEVDVNDLDNPPNAFILQTIPSINIPGYPAPLGGNRVLVIQIIPGDTRFTAQLAFGFGVDRLAIRRRSGNTTWSDWKYFTAS